MSLDDLGVLVLTPSGNNCSLFGLKLVIDEIVTEVTEFLKDWFDPADLEIHFDKPYGTDLVDALNKGQVLPDFDKVVDAIKTETNNKKISIALKRSTFEQQTAVF